MICVGSKNTPICGIRDLSYSGSCLWNKAGNLQRIFVRMTTVVFLRRDFPTTYTIMENILPLRCCFVNE